MSQADFAHEMEMNEGYLSDLENGMRRYNQDILEKAAKILKIPPTYLLSRKPPAPGEPVIDYTDPGVVAHFMDEMDEGGKRGIGALVREYTSTLDTKN